MKKIILNQFLAGSIIIAMIVMAVSIFCNLGFRRIKATDVGGLVAEKIAGANGIRISGLVMHSALSVHGIKLSCEADSIDLDLILVRGDKAPSGSFEFVVFLRPQTKRIRFGKDRVTIWSR